MLSNIDTEQELYRIIVEAEQRVRDLIQDEFKAFTVRHRDRMPSRVALPVAVEEILQAAAHCMGVLPLPMKLRYYVTTLYGVTIDWDAERFDLAE